MTSEVPMRRIRRTGVVIALVVVSACSNGADDAVSTTTTSSTVPPTVPVSTTEAPLPTGAPATTVEPSVTTTVPAGPVVAVWPAADNVIASPEEAAAGFVAAVFGVEPVLGEFRQGDARSGEIEVLPPAEASGGAVRSLLFLRQLGPSDGWFVIGAGNNADSITSPEVGAEVPAGPLTVRGSGSGFEATVIVRAFVAGDATRELDRQVLMAGNLGEVLPFETTLDLSGATPGAVIVLLVSGGVGLETDTGDFSAVPVVIAPA
jgi:hypothetical protein